MDWSLIIGSSGLAGVAYLIFKIGRFTQKMDSHFLETQRNFKELRSDMNKNDGDLRTDMNKNDGDLRTDMNKNDGELRAHMIKNDGELKLEIKELRSEMCKNNRDIREYIDKNFEECRKEIREIKVDISDIKERLVFIEALLFFSGIGPDAAPTQSERMKKYWEKRRTKQIETKEK